MASFNSVSALVLTAVLALFLSAVLLLAVSKPSTSQIINGLTVAGEMCCTDSGNCQGLGNQNAIGVGYAPVHLECNFNNGGGYSQVGLTFTKPCGSFNITVPSTKLYSFEHPTIPCKMVVELPLSARSNCSALSQTLGSTTLVSGLKADGVVTVSVLGLVRNATLTGFVRKNGGSGS